MQQTSLDRWLQRKFVHRTHVYCNTLPGSIPRRASVKEAAPGDGGLYRYRITADSERTVREITRRLESENITYTSRVTDREGIAARLFANPHRSFTLGVVWLLVVALIVALMVSGQPGELWRALTSRIPAR